MLTPLDIENKVFKKRLGGYNREDVEDFMTLLLADYEKLYRENIASKDRIETLSEAVNHYKSQEETMQSAILAAQRAADGLVQSAHANADNIIKEARLAAAEIARESREKISTMEREYAELVRIVENYKIRVGAIITAQLQSLEDIKSERLPDSKATQAINEPEQREPKAAPPLFTPKSPAEFQDTIRFTPITASEENRNFEPAGDNSMI